MKTIFILTLLIALTGCSVAFKTNSSAESNQPATQKSAETETQAAIARKTGDDETEPAQSNLTGTYRYKSAASNNAIGIEDLGGNRLRVHIVANYEYKDNTGEWMANSGGANEVVALQGETAVVVPADFKNCRITLRFAGNKILVKQTGTDSDCGFGANVSADGTYFKDSNKINPNEMPEDETPGGTDEQIRFDPGASSATVNGSLIHDEEKTYVFKAKAGQNATIKITQNSSNNDVVFHLVAPDGSFPMGADEYDTNWSGRLPKSGDYKIVVGTIESKKANFRMLVSIR